MIVTPISLFLVRHGLDRSDSLQKFGDERLTAEGEMQAQAIAAVLEEKGITELYSSPSVPAIQTSKIISEVTGLSIREDNRIRGRDLGVADGLTYNQVRSRYGDLLKANRFGPDWGFPEGETNMEVFLRSTEYAQMILDRSEGTQQRIVVVSHNMVLNFIIFRMQGIGYQRNLFYKFEGGYIAKLERKGRSFSLSYLGSV